MATFYLDFANGNDANDGSSWAQAWKTITAGPTAARIAPGDIVRIAETEAPTSLGNGTWTLGSQNITLASAATLLVDACDGATGDWIQSANVTETKETALYFKEGTGSRKLVIAAGFTTGIIAYQDTATLDCSSYDSITFWIRTTVQLAANTLRLDLCSDNAGATPVDSFTIDHILYANRWYPIVINKGSALGNAIESVALYALLDPGTPTIYLDDISACNDFHLQSLIGKDNGETFMSIGSINGTTVRLDHVANYTATASFGYFGTTETVTTYYRNPYKMATNLSGDFNAVETVQDSGTDGNQITFSGGWNTTTSLQTGETVVSGVYGAQWILIDKNYITFENIEFANFYQGLRLNGNYAGLNVTNCWFTGCQSSGLLTQGSTPNNMTISGCKSNGNGGAGLSVPGNIVSITNAHCSSNEDDGLQISGGRVTVTGDVFADYCNSGVQIYGNDIVFNDDVSCKEFRSTGFDVEGASNLKVLGIITVDTNVAATFYGVYIYYSGNVDLNTVNGDLNDVCRHILYFDYSHNIRVFNCTVTDAVRETFYVNHSHECYVANVTETTASGYDTLANFLNGSLNLHNISVLSATMLTYSGSYYQESFRNVLNITKFAQTAGDNRIYMDGMMAKTNSSVFQDGAFGWELTSFTATAYPDSNTVFRFLPLHFKAVVKANKLVTVSIYIRKTGTYDGTTPKLVIPGGYISGVAADVETNMTAAADTWEELIATCTPTADGVLEAYVEFKRPTAGSLYIDRVRITQA